MTRQCGRFLHHDFKFGLSFNLPLECVHATIVNVDKANVETEHAGAACVHAMAGHAQGTNSLSQTLEQSKNRAIAVTCAINP